MASFFMPPLAMPSFFIVSCARALPPAIRIPADIRIAMIFFVVNSVVSE